MLIISKFRDGRRAGFFRVLRPGSGLEIFNSGFRAGFVFGSEFQVLKFFVRFHLKIFRVPEPGPRPSLSKLPTLESTLRAIKVFVVISRML